MFVVKCWCCVCFIVADIFCCCVCYCCCNVLLLVQSADRHLVSGELQGAADMDRDLASRVALGPGGSP